MEILTSRKNAFIRHIRRIASDSAYRREQEETICDGMKTLQEALTYGAEIRSVLWKDNAREIPELRCESQYIAPAELFDYASPMMNSPGPLFMVRIHKCVCPDKLSNAMILEGVQDPGNVGTVIRTANAFGIDAVILTGDCADLYHPKTVRATMGAVFRQKVFQMELDQLVYFLKEQRLPLYAAALSEESVDIRTVSLKNAAVAVGSEGRGLSACLLEKSDKQIIIPMRPDSESLNAAVAASVLMWEMTQ